MLIHFLFQALNLFGDILNRLASIQAVSRLVLRRLAITPVLACGRISPFHNIGNPFNNTLGRNVVLLIMGNLKFSTALGFIHRPLHRPGDFISVENRFTLQISCRTANGLDQRLLRAQKALFVRIKDSDQGHLWHIQPFTQQIDAHQHIKLPQTQITDNLDPLYGIYI